MPPPLRPSLTHHRAPAPKDAPPLDGPAGDLTAFYSLEGFSSVVRTEEFDQRELLTTLISHIRDSDPQVSLKAINLFQKTVKEIGQVNGLLHNTTASITKETPDGTATLTFSGQSLADRLAQERARSPGSVHHTTHLPNPSSAAALPASTGRLNLARLNPLDTTAADLVPDPGVNSGADAAPPGDRAAEPQGPPSSAGGDGPGCPFEP